MEGQRIERVDKLKYLGFAWTSKMSLKPTIDHCFEKVDKALTKFKWLKKRRKIAVLVLRQCFFAYVFPHIAWIFPFYPFVLKTQQKTLNRKFRVGIRLTHRCPYVAAEDLFLVAQEMSLENYVRR